MRIRFFSDVIDGIETEIRALSLPIRDAATAAMREAGEMAKAEGRADIARAGFSTRWQNALRVENHPGGNIKSVNAAIWIYHKIPYAGVFENNTTIRGRPRLWLPLPNTPKKIGRNRFTPIRLMREGVDLQPFKGRGGKPLLGVMVRVPKSQADSKNVKVTMPMLRRGASGKGVLRTIPVFHGVDSVTIRKRLNFRQTMDRVAARVPELYYKNLQGAD
jgi:hypothetical protein